MAVLLGVVEGVTEFLPISSTGHMLLVEQCLGVDLEGDSFWRMFTVVIQLGAILSVVVYYSRRLGNLLRDFLGSQPATPRWRHPVVLILAAVVPAGVAGVVGKKTIDALMASALPVGLALIGGAVAIELVERVRRGRDRVLDVHEVGPLSALAIGVAQIASLIPGVSRSAATILGGRLCGLSTRAAADFSFLLSIPTMGAAAAYSLYKHPAPVEPERWGVLLVGFVTSFLVAWAVVAWFLHYVR
ncbi:MAG: undecaprenyl-diphosphate phosphatase, partial [Gemmataceae bacterium]|nr:undecaprenyl-diphosphate phosphatase [Gemmataceae bacterium]